MADTQRLLAGNFRWLTRTLLPPGIHLVMGTRYLPIISWARRTLRPPRYGSMRRPIRPPIHSPRCGSVRLLPWQPSQGASAGTRLAQKSDNESFSRSCRSATGTRVRPWVLGLGHPESSSANYPAVGLFTGRGWGAIHRCAGRGPPAPAHPPGRYLVCDVCQPKIAASRRGRGVTKNESAL